MQDYNDYPYPEADDRQLMSIEEEIRYEEEMQGALHRALRKQLEMGWVK